MGQRATFKTRPSEIDPGLLLEIPAAGSGLVTHGARSRNMSDIESGHF